jgi:hypothetical protein
MPGLPAFRKRSTRLQPMRREAAWAAFQQGPGELLDAFRGEAAARAGDTDGGDRISIMVPHGRCRCRPQKIRDFLFLSFLWYKILQD